MLRKERNEVYIPVRNRQSQELQSWQDVDVVFHLCAGIATLATGQMTPEALPTYAEIALGSVILVFIVVVIVAVSKPEALWGRRYTSITERRFAESLAEDVYYGLYSATSNLRVEIDRQQA